MKSIPLEIVKKHYENLVHRIYPQQVPELVEAHFGAEMGLWGALAYIKVYNV